MDCSKTIDFFIETKRLCDSRAACEAVVPNGEQCPLFNFCDQVFTTVCAEDAERAIKILQKWSNEHPKKTYVQDFLEKFPDAPRYESVKGGNLQACRAAIYGGECPGTACAGCWNEPMEE